MRTLNALENNLVAGGETDTLYVVDPVAAAQTFLLLISVSDQESFLYGSVVTGMTVGTAYGGWVGYGAAAASGVLAGLGGAVVGAGAGMVLGGVTFKVASSFAVGVYNAIA